MTFYLPNPEGRQHAQLNRNDATGTIFASKNINMDDEVYIKLAPFSAAVMTTDDDADFDRADAINIGDGDIYVNSSEVFSGEIDYDTLNSHTGDTNRPTPNVEDDTIFFNDTQVVSDGTTVQYKNGSAWVDIGATTITGSAPTCLGLFDGQNALMVGHGNKVDLINTSWGLVRTLTLPNEYRVSSVVANGSIAYIGTRHDSSGEAQLFLWDGNGTSSSESYGIENFEIASLKSFQSSVIAISSDGRVLWFNGGGFEELAVFPVYMTDEEWSDDTNDYTVVSNRGVAIDGNIAYVAISSEIGNPTRYLPHMPGGIWCFDPAVGLYHRHGPTYSRITRDIVSTSDVDIAADQITVTSAPETGTPILYVEAGGDIIGGLAEATTYYAIKVDSTTIQLATSAKNAEAGTAIDLTSTGHSTQFLLIYNVFDYGQQYVGNRQAVVNLSSSTRNPEFAGTLAYSADVETETIGTTKTSLSTYNKQIPNRGYFVTPKLYSIAVDDKYNSIHVRHDTLKDDDQIIVKVRTKETADKVTLRRTDSNSVSSLKGTWTDSDTFTTTQDLSGVSDGDEIEIIAGEGSGVLAHVSGTPTESAGTWTINLDEGFPFANGGEFLFISDNWKKLGTITSDSEKSSFRLDLTGTFLQVKVELRGIETKVIDLMINNKSYRNLI